ncbi:MAG: tetratricopeptide repeat protein, partial [Pseudomonadota bacterium]|nr:tetratricopeptide repeat protein [Pseudomonadota bacterium]
DRAGEASSLMELGNLYDAMGRLEDATRFYRQAADVYVELKDLIHEGVTRSNLADTLVKLGRFDDARREARRAIECRKPYGHVAELWKTWAILHDLETAAGNPQAAAGARQEAMRLFLAYRRDGGENHDDGAQLCALVGNAVRTGDAAGAAGVLRELSGRADLPDRAKTLIPKLQAVLAGGRDPALADDPALYYTDAVELRLLVEGLKGRS